MISRPEEFKHVARDWAQRYAGAPKPPPGSAKTGASGSGDSGDAAAARQQRKAEEKQRRREAYNGYNRNMVDRFTSMGFQVEQVVAAFEYVGVDKADGEEYELDEEYISDITARLFGEM